ncbi:hypothetical protein ZHAS_00012130 [Anopheles sinensis]|uniref:Uncharacterized protein n=1 Tax=Anopheles sinensis TaxID=74873 RepID=A0A084W1Z2_ANOSI|nr:hypothetical protein ZHAS_00012130 [Anopheles sinensis]
MAFLVRHWMTPILVLVVCTLNVLQLGAGVELKEHVPKDPVVAARHTASDHVREILGRAFGADDRSSHSRSHSSSSSSDEHSDNDGRRWDRHRNSCRYVSRSGKDCKCRCSDRKRDGGH